MGERQTDRQTDRDRQSQRQRQRGGGGGGGRRKRNIIKPDKIHSWLLQISLLLSWCFTSIETERRIRDGLKWDRE